MISDLFLSFAPFFKCYTHYVNLHDDATQMLGEVLKPYDAYSFNRKYEKFQRLVCASPRTVPCLC